MMKHEDVVESDLSTIQDQLADITEKLDTLVDLLREVKHKI